MEEQWRRSTRRSHLRRRNTLEESQESIREESLEHTTPMETTPHHRDGGAMEKIHEEVTLEAKEYSGGITGKYTVQRWQSDKVSGEE
ncbi:hypothetical protein ROHU_009479 [Labeo rohita]|uniref:Uncharacterized protein n=1 Tax=Labeo rohita TaxID=84645 RepID=A0A498M2Q2_LABRO|nr:hypothetical protein ROHU_009479 [Labeo rohita]